MIKRRRILYADKIIQNVVQLFCLLMFLQLKGIYSHISNPILLYSTEIDIRMANVDSKPMKFSQIVTDLTHGTAVDFLYRKNLMCWTEQTAVIQCANFNGTHTGDKMKIVSYGLITPSGIAIDWYTENIYWTDGEVNKIEVINIANRHRKVLFWTEVDLVIAMVVVPMRGLMFWTDKGEVPKIERAGMNGDPDTRKIIVKDNILWPNGLTVDYTNSLIYWVDVKLHSLSEIDFEGGNRRTLKDDLLFPYALTFFNKRLFWTDWNNWCIYSYDMLGTDKNTKRVIELNHNHKEVPMDIKVYDWSRQITPETHACKENNGGCSHLCLLSPDPPGYQCSCPTGVRLKDGSNTTCNEGPKSILLVAQRTTICKISLDCPDFTPHPLPLKDVKRVLTVDFDPKSEDIFWSDSVAKSISRARLDGSSQKTIIHTGVGVPETIAVDPSAGNIFWTDAIADTISVARLDGSYKKVIVHGDLYEPRALVLHPSGGLMFWSDWSEKRPKIERANLDGTERTLIVSERLVWPNGLALDTITGKMYWGDARTKKIEVCNFDGSGRQEVLTKDLVHIFGFSILGDYLYWTDIQRRTLERINRITHNGRELLLEQMANMMGVKAINLENEAARTPCSLLNGNCSHLCFNTPTKHVCGCPLGLELGNDRRTCEQPEAFLVYSLKNTIGRVSMERENNVAVLPLKETKEISAIATHVSGLKLYWSDTKTKTINRCSDTGENMEKVLEGAGTVEGLAIDWPAQNIYWTDIYSQRIEVCRLDGSSRRVLLWQGLKKPTSIALDPKKGYMYWSEIKDGKGVIKRAAMDGSNPTIILSQLGKVNSLAIDYDRRAIYWAVTDPVAIEYANLDGTNRKKILDNMKMPYALSLYQDKVFWGDWSTGNIEVANKIDGSNRREVQNYLDYISGLKVFHKSRHSGTNQCSVDNGGCSHLCLAIPNDVTGTDYTCGCPTHYKLNDDNLTCAEPVEFLLYAQKNSIGRIMMAPGECSDVVVPVHGLKNVKAIEYDPVQRSLYWMDEDSHSIRRIPLSYSTTSNSTEVVKNLSKPYHMVLDVLGRALYWSCSDSNSINATSIKNNSLVWSIVKGDKMMPRHLAIHQTKRYLLWNDVGLGEIVRSNLDGTDQYVLGKANNATSLTVDQTTGTVYWAQSRQIYAVDITHNANTRVIWQGGNAYWLGAYSGALYWNTVAGAVMRLVLGRRDAPAQPVPHVSRITVTALVAVYKVDTSHPCMHGGSCGLTPGSCHTRGHCNSGADSSPTCPPRHVLCAVSHKCLPEQWRCDGNEDCPDGSDEAYCGCVGGVECANGDCRDSLAACVGGALCERLTPQAALRCDERLCLAHLHLCDGHPHCEDGSDEAPDMCRYNKSQVSTSQSGSSTRVLAWLATALVIAAAGAGVVYARRRCARPLPPARTLPLMHGKRHEPQGQSDHNCSLSSESTRLFSRYPPTANPPPSPATASTPSPRRRPQRGPRAPPTRPPPPTPASTDADTDVPLRHAPCPPPPSPTL